MESDHELEEECPRLEVPGVESDHELEEECLRLEVPGERKGRHMAQKPRSASKSRDQSRGRSPGGTTLPDPSPASNTVITGYELLEEDKSKEELMRKLQDTLFELDELRSHLVDEREARKVLRKVLRESTRDLEAIRDEFDISYDPDGMEDKRDLTKAEKRFVGVMREVEDALSEVKIKLRGTEGFEDVTSDNIQTFGGEMVEIRTQGRAFKDWKIKYEDLQYLLERALKEIREDKREKGELTEVHNTTCATLEASKQENVRLTESLEVTTDKFHVAEKDISELEDNKTKLETEIVQHQSEIEELKQTLEEEKTISRHQIGELTGMNKELEIQLNEITEEYSSTTERFNSAIEELTAEFELETKTREELQRHRSRLENLIIQLEAQIELLSFSNTSFASNNKKLQIKMKDMSSVYEEERMTHEGTLETLARSERRFKELGRQMDAIQMGLDKSEKTRRENRYEIDSLNTKIYSLQADLSEMENLKDRNSRDIKKFRIELQEWEEKAKGSENKARSAESELLSAQASVKKLTDLEKSSTKLKEEAVERYREMENKFEDVQRQEVKKLKKQVIAQESKIYKMEEDLSIEVKRSYEYKKVTTRSNKRIKELIEELDHQRQSAELAHDQNEGLTLKLRQLRAQLEFAETNASSIGSRYKMALDECDDAEERADSAVKALWVRTHGGSKLETRLRVLDEEEIVTETVQSSESTIESTKKTQQMTSSEG